MWHPMWGWGDSWSAGWTFGLMHVLWWVLAIALVVVIFRAVAGRGRHRDSALEILRERYARGEIDAAEFEERKKQLRT